MYHSWRWIICNSNINLYIVQACNHPFNTNQFWYIIFFFKKRDRFAQEAAFNISWKHTAFENGANAELAAQQLLMQLETKREIIHWSGNAT